MRVLVIDTALDACTAAVFEDDRSLAERSEPMARGHQERIGVLVRDVADQAGGFDGIERIGVTVGPGSFTGLRVGLSFAQGLGAALNRPVVGISTLQALAASAPDRSGPVAAVIDARRGQVYLQTFIDGAPDGEPAPWDIEAARQHLRELGSGWRLIGSGAPLIAPVGAEILALATPTAAALAAMTVAADPTSAPPRPLYLRAPDATPPTRLPGQARGAARERVTGAFEVSALTPGDAGILARLHAQAFDAPWDAPALGDLLRQAGVFGLGVGALGVDAAGFILCRVAADEAEILTLATAPSARGQGLGRRLVEAAAETAALRGATRLFLEVADDNAAARALYARTGFAEVGRRRGYYVRPEGRAVDALVLALDFDAQFKGRLPSA